MYPTCDKLCEKVEKSLNSSDLKTITIEAIDELRGYNTIREFYNVLSKYSESSDNIISYVVNLKQKKCHSHGGVQAFKRALPQINYN